MFLKLGKCCSKDTNVGRAYSLVLACCTICKDLGLDTRTVPAGIDIERMELGKDIYLLKLRRNLFYVAGVCMTTNARL